MASFIDTIKAIITRLIFSAHGVIAIYRVVSIKNDPWFWYLSVTIIILIFEGVFTLAIKKTQEWKFFCPSIFLYLASVCPSIWLIELDKLDTRLEKKENMENLAPPSDDPLNLSSPTILTPSSPMTSAESPLNQSSNVDLGVLTDVGVRADFSFLKKLGS